MHASADSAQPRELYDASISAGARRRWLALPVLLTGAFLPVFDFNVVNLALPAIRQNLGASSSDVQFVISAYATTYAVFLITGGRLGDLYGRKAMFMFGVTGFTLASLLCGIAWSPSSLIIGRILQGLTATAMAPQVLASIRVLFPAAEQAQALALYGATFGLANICGQLLGGVLVSSLAWQAIFLVNVPIGIAALVGSALFLADSRAPQAQKIDIGGVVLLSLALGLLVYPLIEGRELQWPGWMIAMLLASPVALFAFIRFEMRLSAHGGDPLVALSLFRNSIFVTGLAMALAFYMLSSFYLTFAVYLQTGLHRSPLQAGLAMLPFAAGFFASSLASAGLVRRFGGGALTIGFAMQVLGFGIVMSAASAVFTVFTEGLTIGLIIAGAGFGIVMPSVVGTVVGGIDQRYAGLASGIVISTFQIGAALGVAVIGGVFYSALGVRPGLDAYAHAFTVALGCNVVLLVAAGVLSLWLPAKARAAIALAPTPGRPV